jgi:Pentaxin family.
MPNQERVNSSRRNFNSRFIKTAVVLFCACFLFLGIAGRANAAAAPCSTSGGGAGICYVDTNSSGGDGTTQATSSTHAAFATIATVNGYTYTSGDQILFKKGDTWRAQLTVSSSGTSGHPITFGAYGSGNNPVISASNVQGSWTSEALVHENFTDNTGVKPQAWWEFSEASGTRADGNTSNNNTLSQSGGTITHATGPNSFVTSAAHLNSFLSQYLERSDANLSSIFPGKSTADDESVTFGVWVKPSGNDPVQVIGKGDSYFILVESHQAAFGVFNDDYSDLEELFSGSDAVPEDQWTHIVGRWNQATGAMSLFINGVDVTDPPTIISEMIQNNDDQFSIGQEKPSFGDTFYNGDVAEPFVFSSALTNTQINDIYSSGLGGYPATIYYSALAADPQQVLEDGTRLKAVGAKALMTPGTFFWDAADSRIYILTRENNNPSGHVILTGAHDYAITLDQNKYITLTGLTWSGSRTQGLGAWGNETGLLIDNCISEWNTTEGTAYFDTRADYVNGPVTNVIIRNSIFRDNGASGLGIALPSLTGFLITNNDFYSNGKIITDSDGSISTNDAYVYTSGFKIGVVDQTSGSGTVISYNRAYDNGIGGASSLGVGIWLDTSSGMTAEYNIAYNNNGPGLFLEKQLGSTAKYNVLFNNTLSSIVAGTNYWGWGNLSVVAGDGINSIGNNILNNTIYGGWWGIENSNEGGASDTGLSNNNIFHNNIAINAVKNNFYADLGGNNDGLQGSGNIYDHNAFGVQSSGFVHWGADMNTYSALESAYGSVMNNLQTNPLLTNPAGNNFTLQSTSPAINVGVNLGLTHDLGLAPVSVWPSSVVTMSQSGNGSGWEIGAYVYPQAPVISGIATSTTGTTATISWATDKNATSTVRYGTSINYNLASSSNIYASSSPSHSITLRNLATSTVYHFQIGSTDIYGNRVTTSDYTFTTLTPTYTITSSAGSNGTITPLGATVKNFGDSQSYTIATSTGYHIATILVDGSSVSTSSASYTFSSIRANHNIAVTFNLNTYAFTAVPSLGTLTCNGGACSATYNYGTSLSMSATSVAGYTVTLSSTGTANGCISSGGGAGAPATCTATIPAGNTGITATYTPISYTYTFDGNGATTPASQASVTQNYGTSISTPTAPLKTGSTFTSWFPAIPATMPVNGGTSVAQWTINTYTITASAGAHGTVSPDGITTKNYGDNQIYTIATTTAGYHIADILVDGSSIGTSSLTYTFSSIVANHTISATFSANSISSPTTYTIGGTISGLSGTVILQNNGGDNLNISANGSFIFSTPLNNSVGYAVTVLTNTSGQTCAVANGSGIISAANVNNISVSCANNSTAIPVVTFCSAVVYGDWGNCASGLQYRDVLSQSPNNCTLTASQQAVRTQNCGITSIIETPIAENTQPVNANGDITGLIGATSDIVNQVSAVEANNLMQNEQAADLSVLENINYQKLLALTITPQTAANKLVIADFIHSGTPTTLILGSGERAGSVSSFQSAFNRLPANQTDWQDVIKIANGRWPDQRSLTAETRAKTNFKLVYLRLPNPNNTHDSSAIAVMAYGLRPAERNLNSERIAIKSFRFSYQRAPVTAREWDVVRAIAYSGAKR